MYNLSLRFNGNKHELIATENGNTILLINFEYNLTSISSKVYVEGLAAILNSVNAVLKHSTEEIGHGDVVSIVCSMFEYLLNTNGKHIRMLKADADFGLSTCFAAQTLRLFSEDNKLFYCYNWSGMQANEETLNRILGSFQQFKTMMQGLGVADQIVPIIGSVKEQLPTFNDDYFDLVFINGKQYVNVIEEIVHAVKKIKPGGVLLGSYCECYYYQLPEDLRNKQFGPNEIQDGPYHTGVIFALKKIFGDNYQKPISNALVWKKTITEEVKEDVLRRFCYPERKEVIEQLQEIGKTIEKSLKYYETLIGTEDETLNILAQDLGVAISAAEYYSSELANFTGYYDSKQLIVDTKTKFIETVMENEQGNVVKAKGDVVATIAMLQVWSQSLKGIEQFLNKKVDHENE